MDPFHYEVRYVDGSVSSASEADLLPLPDQETRDPVAQLCALDPHPFPLFAAREQLLRSHMRMLRDAGGFRALLSSRIDLHPHQAYVAGVVTRDHRRRYILADEVGLGKTIEAGVVIHDLLLQKPGARVLVLCPGELAQQWLCELYSKFGGVVFRLLDLHERPESLEAEELGLAIVSTTLAGFRMAEVLRSVAWDLVVVDEVHHLLRSPVLYVLVEYLSRAAPGLLLLSALPAQRREDELLRLLHLLEPGRYADHGAEARDRFRRLYDSQEDVGRRLRRLSRGIDRFQAGETEREEVVRLARRLAELEIFFGDSALHARVEELPGVEAFADSAEALVRHVAERYRIDRRILRNRRQKLVAQDQLRPVARSLELRLYDANPLEADAGAAVVGLLRELRDAGAPAGVVHSATRILLQALCSAGVVSVLMDVLAASPPRTPEAETVEYAESGYLAGHAEWPAYIGLLFGLVRHYLPAETVGAAKHRVLAWRDAPRSEPRGAHLLALLRERMEGGAGKLLVFAGVPGTCAALGRALAHSLGAETVREFRAELSRERKEESVREFQTGDRVRVLVCDESGGEGRNFQFVDEIVHFDLPWNLSRLEQRIGRVDRIGRDRYRMDAISHVLAPRGSPEEGLVHCLDAGVGVFRESVSGLEFALRDVEGSFLDASVEGGADALLSLAPAVRELLEEERVRSEADALLDEASFSRSAASRLQRVVQSPEVERELEAAMVEYARTAGSARAAREVDDLRDPGAVWALSPGEIRDGVLPRAGADAPQLAQRTVGTFRRSVAQRRLDLAFFAPGQPVFDALVRSLGDSVAGRTYAIACRAPGVKPWSGFEIVFRAAPAREPVDGRPGLANQVEGVFAPAPLSVFVGWDGAVHPEGDLLLRARSALRASDEGRTWWSLESPRLMELARRVAGHEWDTVTASAVVAGRASAREHFTSRLGVELARENERLRGTAAQLRAEGGEDADEEAQALDALRAALEGWEPIVDAVGVLVVNPEGGAR
jgi:ATP-dependent helicase HepA